MTLRDALESRGRWLFRYRGHLPLLLIPIFAAAAPSVRDVTIDWRWTMACQSIAFAGLGVRALTVGFVPRGTSGRNTTHQVAETLNTTGMYSIVRHPLYLGNGVTLLGIALFFQSGWVLLVSLLSFALYYERIMLAEEAFLRERFGAAFEDWALRVPAFMPRPRLWRTPALPFSVRLVIRREYHGAVAILATFTMLRYLDDLAIAGRLYFDPAIIPGALLATVIFVGCRFAKKHTTLLRVQQR